MTAPSWLEKLFRKSHASKYKLIVLFENILVGTLEFQNDQYLFTYDKGCPLEIRIKGLESDQFRTNHLPPFFSTRLPSKSRPEIEAALQEIGSEDPIIVLGRLSSQSPISPYRFELKSD